MKLNYSILILFLGMCIQLNAQKFWTKADAYSTLKSNERKYSNPTEYAGFTLEINALKQYLKSAPMEVIGKKNKGIAMDIPLPDGTLHSFQVYESPVMEEGLQKKFPSIKSYKGYSLDENMNIRFDVSHKGFFGAISTIKGSIYIDPYSEFHSDRYTTYYTKHDLQSLTGMKASCGFDYTEQVHAEAKNGFDPGDTYLKSNSGNVPVDFRIYRYAVSTTIEFTNREGGTKEDALAAVNSSTNRLNQIYENEMAIRLVLVENNDRVIYVTGDTIPFPDQKAGFEMLGRNTQVLNNLIGSENYDIGHVYGLCTDTGGVARLGSACDPGSKGAGVSCFSGSVIGVTNRVVAHEIGHQMAASHSFNFCGGENESPGTAYEPGSGTTIMSYAGTCGANNVAGDNDDYYHVISLQNMKNHMFLGNGNSCAQITPTENMTPVITLDYPDGLYIPKGTPFVLTGTATDANNDDLTYNWEQFNLGPLSPLGEPIGDAPSFRSFAPGENISRTFPRLVDLIVNRKDDNEVLPTTSRNFTFRLTARDNNPIGGGTTWEEVRFKSDGGAGPFLIEYPSRIENLVVGQEIEVIWDVANTNNEKVNCQNVNILLSSDGGFNYDKALALNTENDGTERIIVPNLPGSDIRFKIEAADNIFFDISNLNSVITVPQESTFHFEPALPINSEPICLPTGVTIPLQTSGFQGFNEMITFEVVDGLPEGASVSFSPANVAPGAMTELNIEVADLQQTGLYDIVVRGTSPSNTTIERTLSLNLVSNDFSDLVTTGPAEYTSEVSVLPTFSWTESVAADTYKIEIATNPSFGSSTVLVQDNISDVTYTPSITLEAGELYYWRVSGSNDCSVSGPTRVSTFHTIALDCVTEVSTDLPVNISASGTREVDALTLFQGGIISDINIKNIKGTHERVSDLQFVMISPQGTEVELVNRKCGTLSTFDFELDDEAPNELACPITGGTAFRPENPLSTFNGEDGQGTWTFRIRDLVPGAGGQLTEFTVEICGSINVQDPFIINNEALKLPPGDGPQIQAEILRVGDDNNTDDELLYTVISLPRRGEIAMNSGAPMSIGESFTQADINEGRIRYFHDNSSSATDRFEFVVEDGESGWIGITRFDIEIDADFVSSTNELQESLGIDIYPNPVEDYLYITSDKLSSGPVQVTLVDLQGKNLLTLNRSGILNEKISAKNIAAGIYFIKVQRDKLVYTEKIVIE